LPPFQIVIIKVIYGNAEYTIESIRIQRKEFEENIMSKYFTLGMGALYSSLYEAETKKLL